MLHLHTIFFFPDLLCQTEIYLCEKISLVVQHVQKIYKTLYISFIRVNRYAQKDIFFVFLHCTAHHKDV